MQKPNCWEIKMCGREPGGVKTGEFGVCPAASDSSVNGINGGKNGGRLCWAIAGTFCGGKIQGDFALKLFSCVSCEVFKQVKYDEGPENFKLMKARQTYQAAIR